MNTCRGRAARGASAMWHLYVAKQNINLMHDPWTRIFPTTKKQKDTEQCLRSTSRSPARDFFFKRDVQQNSGVCFFFLWAWKPQICMRRLGKKKKKIRIQMRFGVFFPLQQSGSPQAAVCYNCSPFSLSALKTPNAEAALGAALAYRSGQVSWTALASCSGNSASMCH